MRTFSAVLLFTLHAAGPAPAGPVVSEGDDWRYFKGTSYPAAQSGVNWTKTNYNDSAWLGPSPSPFGYEDGDDATLLPDMSNGYRSVFTRIKFTIASTANVTRLTLAADYDDGFVAHLNGTEVTRQNMPNGAITNTTLASTSHVASRSTSGPGNEKQFFNISTAPLLNGTNVLAVSGHNSSLASTDFTLSIELYTNLTLVRGPFIQTPDSNTVTIVWRTDALTDSRVDWGSDTNYTGGSLTDTNPVRQHEIELTNRPAGSTIYYRIKSDGVTLDEGASFRTPCATGQPFRFAVIGDFGNVAQITALTTVADRVNTTNVDFLMTVGDNIYSYGQPGNYDPAWFIPYAPTMRRSATFPTTGNHDVSLGNIVWMTNSFVLPPNGPTDQLEICYSYNWGDAHFVVINSNVSVDNAFTNKLPAMVAWLTNDLAHASRFWKIVSFHHPPFTSASVHNENLEMQADIVPVLEKYGVQLVLQGHNHFYERINPIRGVSYFTSGAGGNSLYNFDTNAPPYSAYRNNTIHSFMVIETQNRRMDLRAYDVTGNQIDRRVMDYTSPFITDGERDSAAWGRATNGLIIHAAIRSNLLYLATQDAGEGGDNFLLLAENPSTNRPAPWTKSGTVMQWAALLADENDNGFTSWFGPNEEPLTDPDFYSAMTPGTNNNAPFNNGVLEGWLNLTTLLGHFPTQLLVCAAPYGNADATALLPASQCPTNNGDANITSNEFLRLATRAITLDLPTAAASPAISTNEAGMTIQLTGTGTAPSGYALALNWQQLTGPTGTIGNSATGTTTFLLTTNITTNLTITLRLTANDTRFDTTTNLTLIFTPPLDTDNDGLSNQEELTGLDNLLTAYGPAGHITLPNNPDTDNDGVPDGHESIAGTNPTNATSFLAIKTTTLTTNGLIITWPSTTNRTYSLLAQTNLLNAPYILRTNLPATPAQNTITTPPTPAHFLHLRVTAPTS